MRWFQGRCISHESRTSGPISPRLRAHALGRALQIDLRREKMKYRLPKLENITRRALALVVIRRLGVVFAAAHLGA